MLKGFRFLVLVAGISAIAVSGASFGESAQGYVQEAFGNVSGRMGAGRLLKVEVGQMLPNDSIITTGLHSHVVMKFEDGTAVFLRENSNFHVQNYAYDPEEPQRASAIFNLVRG